MTISRICFSEHTDLNVRQNTERGHDFSSGLPPTNPSSSSAERITKKEPDSGNVLFITLSDVKYPVTIDTLYQVFTFYGPVQKISIFGKNGQFQALVQYPDDHTAATAKAALHDYSIYPDACRMSIVYSEHRDLTVRYNSDRMRDYTGVVTATDPNSSFAKSQINLEAQIAPNTDPQATGGPFGSEYAGYPQDPNLFMQAWPGYPMAMGMEMMPGMPGMPGMPPGPGMMPSMGMPGMGMQGMQGMGMSAMPPGVPGMVPSMGMPGMPGMGVPVQNTNYPIHGRQKSNQTNRYAPYPQKSKRESSQDGDRDGIDKSEPKNEQSPEIPKENVEVDFIFRITNNIYCIYYYYYMIIHFCNSSIPE